MRELRLLLLFLSIGKVLVAQPFIAEQIYQMPCPDTIHIEWGDLNGDGLLDIVAFSQSQGITTAYTMIQQDSVTFQREELTLDTLAHPKFQLKDYNHDGKLDIIYKTQRETGRLVIALNKGNLAFEPIYLDFSADEFIVNDIDHDGDEDIIASTSRSADNHQIYWIKNDTTFLEMNSVADLALLNGDYFIQNESIYTIVNSMGIANQFGQIQLENDSITFLSKAELPEFLSFDLGDLNHDGKVDFVSSSGNQFLINYWNGESIRQDTLASIENGVSDLFICDFDLDGLADILSTTTAEGEGRSIIYQIDGEGGFLADSAFFSVNNGIMNIPADINDDGDMDILTIVTENDSLLYFVQLNQTTISNQGPEPVFINPPLTVYDKTFLGWRLTKDDHTDSLAISYELFIQSEAYGKYHTMPGYDMDTTTRHGFRKVVGHGYQWFDTNYTANSLEDGRYFWGVVGVDNSYYASSDIRACVGGYGPCLDYYTVFNCFDLKVEDTTVCLNSTLVIDLNRGIDSISWYSVKQGFLQRSPILHFQALESDTVYALHYPKIPCGEETDLCVLNYSIAIEVETRAEDLVAETIICPGIENTVQVVGEWDSVRWWYDNVIVAHGNAITLDSVPVIPNVIEAFDSLKCAAIDTLQLKEVDRAFNPESISKNISACQGQATEIDVFSAFNTENLQFVWMPHELFDDPHLPNPMITATQSMEVSVIITEGNCYVDTLIFDLEIAPLPTVTTNGDHEIFRSEKALLEARGAAVYSWFPEEGLQSPGAENTWAEPAVTTKYTVRGSSEQGCYADATLKVLVKNSVYIPDLFSPNGDGNNDFLHVYGEGIVKLSLKVFDERGSFLTEIDGSTNTTGWDGIVSGNELPSGTYFWTLSGEFLDGEPVTYLGKNNGTIRLVR
jgi:gliding motility-associated-like protein